MSTSVEDRICVALLFCATFGVGSMSFGSIFAATGPLVASLAMYFLSACNLHASIAVSKSMTIVPTSVRTFSDLGYYAFGDLGRRVVLISEGGACFLSPIAFLILGGTKLLPTIFANVDGATHTETTWIIVMALGVLPVVLIPTLKGTGVLCYIGAAVAVLCDVICIVCSLTSLPFLPRETELAMDNVISTFGTIMFAMGTAIIIPPIQRQHTDPTRLGNLVGLTLLMITSLYMIIGIVTYYQYGCTAPVTLLDQLPPGKWSQLAAALMLIHITIAFPVMLNPALFDLERYLLGKDADIEVLQQSIARRAEKMAAGKPILGHAPTIASLDDDGFLYGRHHSPGGSRTAISNSPPTTTITGSATNAPDYFHYQSPTASTISSHDATTSGLFSGEDYSDVTFTPMDRVFSILIRTLTIAIQCFLAIAFQSSFLDILSLIGATVITITCLIMPCLCYLKVYPIPIETFMGRCDRALCYIIIITTTCLGLYCTILAAGNIQNNMNKYTLFGPPLNSTITISDSLDGFDDDPVYPYCHMGEQN